MARQPRTLRPASSRRRKTYFFSDVHLGLSPAIIDRDREMRLVRFLDRIKKDAEGVYILGDLFDYWFEYGTVVPKGHVRTLAKLGELTDMGIPVTYLAGNHDFWVKTYFTDELGVEVCPEPVERVIRGKRFFLHHGDGVIQSDVGYRILKRVLRNRVNIFLFSLLHPDLTSAIARWSSRTSRNHTRGKTFEGADMITFAEEKIRSGFDYVLMGHNHNPALHHYLGGTYMNLGDWITSMSYAVFDGKRLDLQWWEQ